MVCLSREPRRKMRVEPERQSELTRLHPARANGRRRAAWPPPPWPRIKSALPTVKCIYVKNCKCAFMNAFAAIVAGPRIRSRTSATLKLERAARRGSARPCPRREPDSPSVRSCPRHAQELYAAMDPFVKRCPPRGPPPFMRRGFPRQEERRCTPVGRSGRSDRCESVVASFPAAVARPLL
jgi:hypothetical protein